MFKKAVKIKEEEMLGDVKEMLGDAWRCQKGIED